MTQVRCFLGTLLDEVAGDAALAARTTTIDLRKDHSGAGTQRSPVLFRGTAVLDRDTATNMTITMSLSIDGGTIYGRQQSINLAGGTGLLSDYTPTKTQSSDFTIDLQLDVRGATHLKIVLAAAAGVAADKMSLLGAIVQEV